MTETPAFNTLVFYNGKEDLRHSMHLDTRPLLRNQEFYLSQSRRAIS
jgi:hypothetical protein